MDAFSRSVAELIFSEFPAWRSLAREEMASDGETYLVIKVTDPQNGDVILPLVINTSNEEITVGFDYFHSHFDDWTGECSREGFSSALEFIKAILSERVGAISWWRQDGVWARSSWIEAGKPFQSSIESKHDRIRIRSWKGTLNADIKI